jgi:6-phospho-3-hexuloisomerase
LNLAHGSPIEKVLATALAEVRSCIGQISSASLGQALASIEVAPRIFVAGAGRSGLCMRALAMRLMHLGKTAYVVGEVITPSVAEGDLLVFGSASGETASLLTLAKQGHRYGAKSLLFTASATSSLAMMANILVTIPVHTIEIDAEEGERRLVSIQPLGALFEQCLFMLNDALILALMDRNGVSAKQMADRHANLE